MSDKLYIFEFVKNISILAWNKKMAEKQLRTILSDERSHEAQYKLVSVKPSNFKQ